jgi:hypothetical protein
MHTTTNNNFKNSQRNEVHNNKQQIQPKFKEVKHTITTNLQELKELKCTTTTNKFWRSSKR